MADTNGVDKFVKEHNRSIGAAHNRAGLADMDRETQHTMEEESKKKDPPNDPQSQEVLKRLGLL